MANYKITLTVPAARHSVVEKKLKEVFGEETGIYSVEKVKTAASRADRLGEAEAMAEDCRSVVEELKDEMEQWRDSIPENLQSGEKYSEVDECCNQLEEIQSTLEQLDFSSVSFPGMF